MRPVARGVLRAVTSLAAMSAPCSRSLSANDKNSSVAQQLGNGVLLLGASAQPDRNARQNACADCDGRGEIPAGQHARQGEARFEPRSLPPHCLGESCSARPQSKAVAHSCCGNRPSRSAATLGGTSRQAIVVRISKCVFERGGGGQQRSVDGTLVTGSPSRRGGGPSEAGRHCRRMSSANSDRDVGARHARRGREQRGQPGGKPRCRNRWALDRGSVEPCSARGRSPANTRA